MILLEGKQTAEKLTSSLKALIEKQIQNGNRIPRLDIVLVGEDFGSQKYVEMKRKKAEELGIDAVVHEYSSEVTQEELEKLLDDLSMDNGVDGLMVQLPLPSHIKEKEVLEKINPLKDVDGLTSVNLGKLFKNDLSAIAPATPKGIMELLKEYSIDVDGMNAVVIGRSEIVGLPVAAMLINSNATVTVCHSHTKNLKDICKSADLLVVSIGKEEYINSEYVKDGCIVVDVGTNKNSEGKLVGDVDFESVKDIAGYITPVPGGVGPMTIASLLLNLFDSYKRNVERK